MSQENSHFYNGAASAGIGEDGARGENPGGEHPSSPSISQEDYENYLKMVPSDDYYELMSAGIKKTQKMPVKYDENAWRKNLVFTEKDGAFIPDPKSQNNFYLLTRFSPNLRGMFILNEFSQRKMVVKCPPWENPEKFRPRDIRDDDYARIQMELEHMAMRPKRDDAVASINAICHDRSFHPVQKYFQSLKWDGERRLEKWLSFYLGAESDPIEYIKAVGSKWMVAAVARVFNPATKFDHMLVLESVTDLGKSSALRKLATFHGEEYFYDGMTFAKISDKDTMQNIQGHIIIEFPELSSLGSREVEEVKQWITIQEDKGRKPYGREPVVFKRQFVLAGTTNNNEYLKDATGNKRFWPVKCGERFDLVSLERDREQLWAEAVHLYKSGFIYWLPEGDPLIPLFKECQRRRMMSHPWEDDVIAYCDKKTERENFVTIRDILVKAIDMPLSKIKRADEMIVADILKMNGYQSKHNGKQRGWEKIVMQHKMVLNSERDIGERDYHDL